MKGEWQDKKKKSSYPVLVLYYKCIKRYHTRVNRGFYMDQGDLAVDEGLMSSTAGIIGK